MQLSPNFPSQNQRNHYIFLFENTILTHRKRNPPFLFFLFERKKREENIFKPMPRIITAFNPGDRREGFSFRRLRRRGGGLLSSPPRHRQGGDRAGGMRYLATRQEVPRSDGRGVGGTRRALLPPVHAPWRTRHQQPSAPLAIHGFLRSTGLRESRARARFSGLYPSLDSRERRRGEGMDEIRIG